jgi:hypothetical protein
MSDETGDLALVREVHRALRCYRNELRLAQSPLLELLAGHQADSGPLGRAIALRRLLCAALERLSLEDEMLGPPSLAFRAGGGHPEAGAAGLGALDAVPLPADGHCQPGADPDRGKPPR